MFMFDIETLGTESTSVVLSASIIHFEFGEKYTYQELVERALFVKFNASEQVEKYKRVITKESIEWWSKQAELPRKISFVPKKSDLPALEGIAKIKKYIKENGGAEQMFWARGSLDQMVIDSLCLAIGEERITQYNNWRDVRTAVDFLSESSKNGYCPVKNFNADLHVIKHIPQNDCALDIMMMLYPA